MPELAEVTIRWRGEAREVKLAGEFNNWEPETITREGESWVRVLSLAPGQYAYKFVVDGEWRVCGDLPSARDQEGNTNNVIQVEDTSDGSGSGGDSDSWEKVSIPDPESGPAEAEGAEDPMTTSQTAGANMQKISVVERVYSMPVSADHEKFAADNNGVLSSVESSTSTFMDTRDSYLQRKAIWLCKVSNGDTVSWKLSTIDKAHLKTFHSIEEVTEIIQEVLKSSSSLDQIASSSLVEYLTKTVTVSKWSFGETELETRAEDGRVTRALLREVGDVAAALANIEGWAARLQCRPYTTSAA